MSKVITNSHLPANEARHQEENRWVNRGIGTIVLDSAKELKKRFPAAQPEREKRTTLFYALEKIIDMYEGEKTVDHLVRFAVQDPTQPDPAQQKKYVAYQCLKCKKVTIGMPEMFSPLEGSGPGHLTVRSLEFYCRNCGKVIYKVEF